MMSFLGTILGLLSFVVFIWACVGLFAPERARLSSRWQSVLVWAISVILLVIGTSLLPDESTQQHAAVREETASERPASSSADKPCTPKELSPAALELVRLYEELHTFKDDPEFIRVGFVRGGPYSAWMEAVKAHQDRTGFELLDEVEFLPSEVMMLGMLFVGDDLSESDLSSIEFYERKIQAGLALARCDEPGSEWQETVRASSEARQAYVAEAEAKILARESQLGRPLTDEERTELAFERLRGVLEAGEAYPGQRAAERATVALGDRMREIDGEKMPEYKAALARFDAASRAAERGDGTWAAALATGEMVLALATEIGSEMSSISTEMAALVSTAPPEVAALAEPRRMEFEQARTVFESVVVVLQDQLELMRAQVAELAAAEHRTPRGRVTLAMMDDARLAIKNSDDSVVEVSLGGSGGIENRQRTIFLEVLRGTSVFHAKELGENAVRIVERLWSDKAPADYTIVVSRTGPPVRSSRESEERTIVEGSKGRFESDISWR